MLEKEASIKGTRTVMKLQQAVIYSPLERENPVEKLKKLPVLLTSLLVVAASAAWTTWPLSTPTAAVTPAPPTPFATLPPTKFPQGGPPLSLTLILLFTCCALGAVIGVIILGFVLNVSRRKESQAEEKP